MLNQNFNHWKKAIVLALAIGMTVICAGCTAASYGAQIIEGNLRSAEAHHIYPLLFNTPNIISMEMMSPDPNFHYFLDLTDEQLNAVFPKLDFNAIQLFNAEAFYTREDTLVEVVLRFGNYSISKISIGVGGQPVAIFTNYSYEGGFIPEQSNVHGIPVTAYMLQESDTRTIFRTFFVLGDESFFIHLEAADDGQTLMTEIVNMLILGGTDGLATLAR